MDKSLLLGVGHHTMPIPQSVWKGQVRGKEGRLDFMTEAHHQIRNFVVTELPRVGEPLAPELISQRLGLPLDRVVGLLDDLEKQMTFLFRNEHGAVEWAYPVTAAHTPHRVAFSTGERINAA